METVKSQQKEAQKEAYLKKNQAKLLEEMESIVEKFQADFIYKRKDKLKNGNRVKYYGEGAMYEGMFVDVSPHPRTNLPPSHHLTPP